MVAATQTKPKQDNTPKNLRDQIWEIARLGRGGAWLKTTEMQDACHSIELLESEQEGRCTVKVWNCIEGTSDIEQVKSAVAAGHGIAELTSPNDLNVQAAIGHFMSACDTRDDMSPDQLADAGNFILVLRNGHREVVNNTQTQKNTLTAMQLAIERGKTCGCLLVIAAHAAYEVPDELNELVWHVSHDLPDTSERREILTEIEFSGKIEKPTDAELDQIASITGGLTRNQIEGVVGMSLLRHRRLCEMEIAMHKTKLINDGGLLTVHEPQGGFETLGGLNGIKQFLKQVMRKDRPADVRPKGVLLLGLPGVGKSHIAKALGAETDRPTVSLDIGALMGGIVGQTEERTRQALATIDSIAPCVAYLDKLCPIMV